MVFNYNLLVKKKYLFILNKIEVYICISNISQEHNKNIY